MFRGFSVLLVGLVSFFSFAKAPTYEDFFEYGEIEEGDVHDKRKGEFLYGDTEFGLIAITGNTDTLAIKFKANIYQDLKLWRNQFKFDGLLKKDKQADLELTTTGSRLFFSSQGNYKIGDNNSSFFMYGDYEKDKFSGFKYQVSLATGYGNRLYSDTENKIDFDIGPGLSYRVDNNDSVAGYLLRLAVQWQRDISETTRFNQNLSAEHSLSGLNSRFKAETSLLSQISNALSLKFSYLYRFNSQPEVDKVGFDKETSATLVYSFN